MGFDREIVMTEGKCQAFGNQQLNGPEWSKCYVFQNVSTMYGIQELNSHERRQMLYFEKYPTYVEFKSLIVSKVILSAKYLELNSWMVLKEGKW